jgi:hypothetical protein
MSDPRCEHGKVICSECVIITDAARRMTDAVTLAIMSNDPAYTARGWMAFKLEDGSSDHVVYPSKQVAIQHVSNEYLYCYLCLNRCMAGMPVKDAQLWLDLHRHVYSHGGRLTDPVTDIIMPVAREQRITRAIQPVNRWIPWENGQKGGRWK